MGLRFFRRFNIFPGVTLNVSRSGVSVSLGPRGAKLTFGGPQGTRGTVGLPGTGLFYTKLLDPKGGRRARGGPTDDEALAAAHDHLLAGDEDAALRSFVELADRLPDAAFVAGVLLLRAEGSAADAERYLRKAKGSRTLGRRLESLGADVHVELPIDADTRGTLRPDRRGATLALAEALQRQGRIDEAVALVRGELRRDPADALLLASLDDLADEA